MITDQGMLILQGTNFTLRNSKFLDRCSIFKVLYRGSMLLLFAACAGPADSIRIEVLSSPAEFISGGEARVAVHLPEHVALDAVSITLGERDITDAFAMKDGRLEGVVTGLKAAPQSFQVTTGTGQVTRELSSFPATGPLFSGPAQMPFLCATAAHRENAMLGEAVDDDCTIERTVSFVYKSSTTDQFEVFDPDVERPADVAQTTTLGGKTVDYIVRWERGTINRFIYSIAVLSPEGFDEASPELSAWNRRLIYYFQGGVGIGHYQGNPNRQRMLYDYGLSKGYAIAYSTGTRTSTHYDLEVGGETAIMVKDRFVTAYGDPLYTVGVGSSGGGIQQYVYGQNHPGLIDAGIPQYAYSDMITQTIHVGDCELLERYMDAEVARNPVSKWAKWTNRPWLEGMNASATVPNPYNGNRPGNSECINGWRGLTALTFNPHYGTAPGITPEARAEVEWTHYNDAVQIYGVDKHGYGRRTWDNVGVQYGLQALLDDHITPEEFLDLNARIGGWKPANEAVQEGRPYLPEGELDIHSARNMTLSPNDSGNPPAPRTAGDPEAIAAAYAHGLVFTGRLDIPLIDWRHYLEDELDMHNSHQSFAARQRLLNHDDDASNQVIWFTDVVENTPRFDQTPMAFEVIDQWMLNIAANPDAGVAANKPERAVDSCFDAAGTLIASGDDAWAGILDDTPAGACTQQFELHSTSRIVAGGPITGDVFKCALQPVAAAIERGLYGDWTVTPAQQTRLEEIFPTGVCDYAQ